MTHDALSELRNILHDDPPQSVKQMTADDIAKLVDAIKDARRRQRAALMKVSEETLQVVPFPLKGLVKAVLFK